MKTTLKYADDIKSGDKIVVDGIVKEVYDADYVIPEWSSTVGFTLVDGSKFTCGSAHKLEVVEA